MVVEGVNSCVRGWLVRAAGEAMLEPTAGWILDSKSWSVVTVVVATTTPPPPSDSHHHHHWLQPVTAVLALLEDGRTGAYLLFSSP